MSINLTRMTLYVLVSAIEMDLRKIIKDYVCEIDLIDNLLIEKSKKRIEKDFGEIIDDLSLPDIVDYLDIGDLFQIINSNKVIFPSVLSLYVKSITPDLERLVPIRNRVMHIRPLNFDDLPFVNDFCQRLVGEGHVDSFCSVRDSIDSINKDPRYVFTFDFDVPDKDDLIANNLPVPDFDETGLIGRDDEIKKVKNLCLGGFPVVSIVGEGGVGKTALALKVAYELAENSDFDAIVWVTSKTTQITLNEVKEIKGAINTSLGVIQDIGRKLNVGDGGSDVFDDVIDYLSKFKIALFIDNLETVLDEGIRRFVEALPPGSKIIITSRIGLGAYEYPFKLQGIHESYASKLLRTLAKIRNVNALSNLEENTLRKYVNRMHCNPSYIKWFVSCVQAGITPEAVLQKSDVFLDFCMSNVYEYLSKSAKHIVSVMQCSPGMKSIPEMVYLAGLDSEIVLRSIQELMATNMLDHKTVSKGSSVKSTYQLTELPRAYLAKNHPASKDLQRSIREKYAKSNSMYEENSGKRNSSKYSLSNINLRDKSDRFVMRNLFDVQGFIRKQDYVRAFKLLEEARSVAPDYYEVARHLAWYYEEVGDYVKVVESYDLAIVLSPDTPQTYYWYGNFLLRGEYDVDLAVSNFETAARLDSDSIDVSLALARGYMFQHRFDESTKVLDDVICKLGYADDRQLKIYYDTRIQIEYRLADDYFKDGNLPLCLHHLNEMRSKFSEPPEVYRDIYLRKKLKKCEYITSKLVKSEDLNISAAAKDMASWIEAECY